MDGEPVRKWLRFLGWGWNSHPKNSIINYQLSIINYQLIARDRMYKATAAYGSAIQQLKRFPDSQKSELLIHAGLELTIAYNLMRARWEITNSIFWKTSNAATKRSVRLKVEGMTFDAVSSLLKAGELLNRYFDRYGIPPQSQRLWQETILCLHHAQRWTREDFYLDSTSKQLKLDLKLQ